MPRNLVARPVLCLLGLIALLLPARAQGPAQGTSPLLREAGRDEIWITSPTIGVPPPVRPRRASGLIAAVTDATPPSAPGNLTVSVNGLFRVLARWEPSTDAESGIDYYAFALGTGTTPETQANVRWWQSNGTRTTATISMTLTEGATYYLSVRANNGANLPSSIVRSAPLVAARSIHGEAANVMSFEIAPEGLDASGAPTAAWPSARVAELTDFMNKMLPVLKDLYGPPSTSYQVRVVRDLRYVTSAIFFPSADEIHVGDTVTYQLLTHELIHALRRDRCLSSDGTWQYDPTLSGFEEGFAQAVSYDAMTEFARRYPSFGLTQQLYESSNAWDYDFQNVPQLRTTDFWSDTGGMNLHYRRYEMAAAAIAKIEIEHPGFYKAFNAEYYRRLNASPLLTPSRTLVRDIIQTVTSTIEGMPAGQWIDRQYVFACENVYGTKLWLRTYHYPSREYFVFNYIHLYETFSNGSDWAVPLPGGGYQFHRLNGSAGMATLTTSAGEVVWQQAQQITPVANPPTFFGFGFDEVHLTTQASPEPWPGGDATKFVTSLLPLDLYRLTETFIANGAPLSATFYRVIGAQLRNTTGVFGGVLGASGGRVLMRHRAYQTAQRASLSGEAFWLTAPWASIDHPATSSNDTIPGLVDVVYIDAGGTAYTAVRAIGIGSWNGNQAFLFDKSVMSAGNVAPLIVSQPANALVVDGTTATFSAEGDGPGSLSYQWQRRAAGATSFSNVINGGPFSGVTTATLSVGAATAMSGDAFRCIVSNLAGSATTETATLTVGSGLIITAQPASVQSASGLHVTLTVAATGNGTLSYQWHRRPAGTASVVPLSNGSFYANVTGATLTVVTAQDRSGDQFTCVVSDATQSVTSAAATVTVVDAPIITVNPVPASVTGPATVIFNVVATGSAPLAYSWQRKLAGATAFGAISDDGGSFAGAGTPTLSVAATAPMSGDLFRAVVSNAAGSVTSGSALLTVVSLPVITGQPVDQIVTTAGSPRFIVTASGTEPLSYQWQRRLPGEAGFADLSAAGYYAGVTGRELTVTPEPSLSGQQFRCIVSNAFGSATSHVVTLTVGSVPVITVQPLSIIRALGVAATFSVSAIGSGVLSYQWQRRASGSASFLAMTDGGSFSGTTTGTLTVIASAMLSGDEYRCVVTDGSQSATSASAALTVGSGLMITAQPANVQSASGLHVTFTVAATGNGTLSYQWQRRAAGTESFVPLTNGSFYANVTGATLTVVTAQERSGDQFRCVVSDAMQSVTSAAATVTVVDAPTITANPVPASVTGSGTVMFNVEAAGSAPLAYSWQRRLAGGSAFAPISDVGGTFAGTGTPTLSVAATAPMSGDLFRAVVSNAAGSVTSGSAQLTVVSAPAITGQPVDQIVTTAGSPRFVVTASGTEPLAYQWQRRLPGETGFADLIAGTFYAGVTGRDLAVTPEIALSGQQFRCIVSNAFGSATTNVVTLTVGSVPVITVQPLNIIRASGLEATFSVFAVGSGVLSYQWQRQPAGASAFVLLSEGGGFSGTATSTLSIAATAAVSGDLYRAIVTNSAGSATSAPASLTVVSAPVITGQPADQIVTTAGNPRFVVTVSGTAPLTYRWERRLHDATSFVLLQEGGFYAGTTARELAVTPEPSLSGQQFRCIVSNVFGSATSNVVTLTVGTVPAMTTQPVSRTVHARRDAVFTIAASGSPVPAIEWQLSANGVDWSPVVNDATFAGAATASLTAAAVPRSMNGVQLRAKATNIFGSATSAPAQLTVVSDAIAAPSALVFAASRAADQSLRATPVQRVALDFEGAAAFAWTVTGSQPWVQITSGSGTGAAEFSVGVSDPALAQGTLTAAVTITAPGAANSPLVVPLTLTIRPAAEDARPFGTIDSPSDGATGLGGSFAITGWALDDVGIERVEIWRDVQPGETTPPFESTPSDPRRGKIFIGQAPFVDGARPDVETLYGTTPMNRRAGWGYLLLSWGLWNQGNGQYRLHAFAFDVGGQVAALGSRTVSVNNSAANRPFGSVDTPGIGGTVGGTIVNFGWGLTPNTGGATTCTIRSNGVQVSIDSGPLQPVAYGDARTDIAGAFPGFSNAGGAGGHYILDTTQYANGTHTIGWLITDDCNRADGVGSRFFTVQNGGQIGTALRASALRRHDLRESEAPITVARGHGELPLVVEPGLAGSRTIEIKQGERIELRLPRGYAEAFQLGLDGQVRPLPLGSTWDRDGAIFYWQPAPGFFGRYRIVFSDGRERISIRVIVTP